ncbi:MAG: hypothetical protein FJ083_15485 [Cyanobacteria bacterium K_Offshore_surface_m2_239]|nr:hypothetical protein [Cyanobacteria bacterium K_Offshore_surface_m2_239]
MRCHGLPTDPECGQGARGKGRAASRTGRRLPRSGGHSPVELAPSGTRGAGGGQGGQAVGTSPTGRLYCRELTWQQAQELLRQGNTYLDGNGDGEACEGRR